MLNVEVAVLEDREAVQLPREAARGLAHWGAETWRPYDAAPLAAAARALCAAKLPGVAMYQGSPRGLSWWCALNPSLSPHSASLH